MASRLLASLLLAASAAPTLAAVDFNRDAYAWRESALCYAVTGEAYWWTRGRTLRNHLEELDRETAGKATPAPEAAVQGELESLSTQAYSALKAQCAARRAVLGDSAH
ncbi:MAG: hypothetical protein ACO2YV_03805 [Pseudomonadales bacterium]